MLHQGGMLGGFMYAYQGNQGGMPRLVEIGISSPLDPLMFPLTSTCTSFLFFFSFRRPFDNPFWVASLGVSGSRGIKRHIQRVHGRLGRRLRVGG